MSYGRRSVLSRADRIAGIRHRAQLAQDRMTPAEISALMRKTIHEALDRNGAVSRDDLVRANIPAHAIETYFRAIVMEVVDERAHGGIRA